MKHLSSLMAALLLAAPASAESLLWDPHPQAAELSGFNLYQSTNNGQSYATISIPGGQTTSYSLGTLQTGIDYAWKLSAVGTNKVESEQTAPLLYRKVPPLPAINLAGALPASYSPPGKTWGNFRVFWSGINLATYGATNYALHVTPPVNGIGTFFTTQPEVTFLTLPATDYTFEVRATNAVGGSPAGFKLLYSGFQPHKPNGGSLSQ